METLILAINGGSSSLKYGAFVVGECRAETVVSGAVESGPNHTAGFDEIAAKLGGARPNAIGHRIVHGGPTLFRPTLIDDRVLSNLRAACAFAPLHGPVALDLIAAARRRYPGTPQIACFDTGFHEHLPAIAAVLPVPKALQAAGVRRYGFHGLSCQSIVRQFGADLPKRLVIAHLGSGASVTAVLDGASVDTSMGLTPSGGVVMATRSGDLDPGLLLFLLREHGMTAGQLEGLLDRESGLLGISDRSGDLQILRRLACGRAWRMIRRRGITCRSQRADYRMAEVGKAVNRLDRPLLGPSSRACFQRSHQRSRSVATRTIYPLDVTGELVGMEVDRPKATSGVAVDLVSKVQ